MQRILILGRGGAGKSTLARKVAELTGLDLIELDSVFWSPDLRPTPRDRWREKQRLLCSRSGWIMDGDLGPYDSLEVRLAAADTVVVLDLPLIVCVWRVLRRGRERSDFWRWMLCWRMRERPRLLAALDDRPRGTRLVVIRSKRELARFLAGVA